jgi:hypothetical protein
MNQPRLRFVRLLRRSGIDISVPITCLSAAPHITDNQQIDFHVAFGLSTAPA